MDTRGLRWAGMLFGAATWLLLCFYAPGQLADRANMRIIESCRAQSGPDAACFTDITSEAYGGAAMLINVLLIGVIVLGYFLYVRRAPARPGQASAKRGQPKLFAPVSVIVAAIAIPLIGWLGWLPLLAGPTAWHHCLWPLFILWLAIGIFVRQRDGRAERTP